MTEAAKAPVMTDVARLAGVSHMTVSRVINGSPDIKPETRERVLQAIERLLRESTFNGSDMSAWG